MNFSPNILPRELEERRKQGETIALLDVREPEEIATASLGGIAIPLGELASRLGELEAYRDQELVVLCHHGIRSAHATQFLRLQGFSGARNLSGGIDRWSLEVDPSVPRY